MLLSEKALIPRQDACRVPLRQMRYLISKAKKRKGGHPDRPPRNVVLVSLVLYLSKVSICCGPEFACASIAIPACCRIWFLVKSEISDAISTSRIVDSEDE